MTHDELTANPTPEMLAWMAEQCDRHAGRKDCARREAEE